MPGTALGGYIQPAFGILNIVQAGATIPAAQAQQALLLLNVMISGWAQQVNTQTVVAREETPILTGRGGPNAPYGWGIGLDIDSPPPANQGALRAVSLILTSASPTVEVPLALLTDDAWQGIAIKDLAGTQPTCAYFVRVSNFAAGGLYLYPVPNNANNRLALYTQLPIGQFADLNSTVYTFPDGFDEAIIYNLVLRLADPFGRQVPPYAMQIAQASMKSIMGANLKMLDMPNDMCWNWRYGLYNINSGNL